MRGLFTWPNKDDWMNMTKILWTWPTLGERWTLFIEHDRKIINNTTTTNLKVWIWLILWPTNLNYKHWSILTTTNLKVCCPVILSRVLLNYVYDIFFSRGAKQDWQMSQQVRACELGLGDLSKLTVPAHYLNFMFAIAMVWSNSTLRFVVVKK